MLRETEALSWQLQIPHHSIPGSCSRAECSTFLVSHGKSTTFTWPRAWNLHRRRTTATGWMNLWKFEQLWWGMENNLSSISGFGLLCHPWWNLQWPQREFYVRNRKFLRLYIFLRSISGTEYANSFVRRKVWRSDYFSKKLINLCTYCIKNSSTIPQSRQIYSIFLSPSFLWLCCSFALYLSFWHWNDSVLFGFSSQPYQALMLPMVNKIMAIIKNKQGEEGGAKCDVPPNHLREVKYCCTLWNI